MKKTSFSRIKWGGRESEGGKTNLRADDSVSSEVFLHGSSMLSKFSEVDGVCRDRGENRSQLS